MKLKIESHEATHKGVECDTQTSKRKRGNEDKSAEGDSKAYKKKENYDVAKAKKKKLENEVRTLSSLMKKKAKSCLRLQRKNKKLMKELKGKCSKDEISKLEAMNPDGNSQSVDEEQDQNSSESWGKFNSSPDCSTDIDEEGDSPDCSTDIDEEGDSDSPTPMQKE